MDLQLYKFEYSRDPVRLEDQIQRLMDALGLIKKGIRVLLEMDQNEPRVRAVKRGILRVLAPYEELLQQKKLALKRVLSRAAKPRRRRNNAK